MAAQKEKLARAKAAFFDVDGTLVDGVTLGHFSDFLTRKGIFNKEANNGIQTLKLLYHKKRVQYYTIAVAMPALYAMGLEGKKQADVLELGSDFGKECRKNLMAYSEGLVALFNEKGYFTIAISGSPTESVNAFNLGFRETRGTEAEVLNGIYTGKVALCLAVSSKKKEILNLLVIEHKIDLKASYAFGDSDQDLAMLDKVGHPMPLNPTTLLRKHAENSSWPIPDPSSIIKEVKRSLELQ